MAKFLAVVISFLVMFFPFFVSVKCWANDSWLASGVWFIAMFVQWGFMLWVADMLMPDELAEMFNDARELGEAKRIK